MEDSRTECLSINNPVIDTKSGDSVQMNVDVARREFLKSNHSATHLMHEALREVLGDHVMQKGFVVMPERLRFDFSHTNKFQPLSRQARLRLLSMSGSA